jgi:hypothetical protein
VRRILELVYAVEGVVSARVWQWPGRIAVGVRAAPSASHGEVLRRVEQAVFGIREQGEAWDFGLLEEG